MSRVSQVRPSLFLGGLDSVNSAVLRSRNITLIIDASNTPPLPPGPPHPPGEAPPTPEVLLVPVQDRPHAALWTYFDRVALRIEANRGGATLIHCTAGRSRSPTLSMAYLMKCEGLSLRQAHAAVLQRRPSVRPNAGFWRQLIAYERSLFGRCSVRMARTDAGVLPEALGDGNDGNEAQRDGNDGNEAQRDGNEAQRDGNDGNEAQRDGNDGNEAQRDGNEAAYCINV